MTSDSKTTYIHISDDMANKYNNTYHTIIRIKPAVVKSSTYIESSKYVNNKDPKFNYGDLFRIWKYKNICSKGYPPNW